MRKYWNELQCTKVFSTLRNQWEYIPFESAMYAVWICKCAIIAWNKAIGIENINVEVK